jgi:hypothetical protein
MKRFALLLAVGIAAGAGCAERAAEPLPAGHPADPASAESPVPTPVESLRIDGPAVVAAAPARDGAHRHAPTDEEAANIRKLPQADQKAALAQGVCAVGGEPLGSMGVPIRMTADGRTVFLCCKGCEPEFRRDPAAILRKLLAAPPRPAEKGGDR